MTEKAKHYLVECLLIKNENKYLLEHLTKNKAAGIEHFYIYDNLSDECVWDYLENNAPELLNCCTIHLIPTSENLQYDCYQKFLNKYADECTWVAFIDTDEMFEGNLLELCRHSENTFNALIFNQIIHGANNQIYESDKPLFERFGDDVLTNFKMVKNVVQNKYLLKHYAHSFLLTDNPLTSLTLDGNSEVKLHHFYFRSFEEYVKKMLRGSCNPKGRPFLDGFFQYNTNISKKSCKSILKKYNVDLNLRMEYGGREI